MAAAPPSRSPPAAPPPAAYLPAAPREEGAYRRLRGHGASLHGREKGSWLSRGGTAAIRLPGPGRGGQARGQRGGPGGGAGPAWPHSLHFAGRLRDRGRRLRGFPQVRRRGGGGGMRAADETRASPALSSPAWPRRLRAGSGSAPWTPGRPHSLGGSAGQGAGPPRSPALLGRSNQSGCYLRPVPAAVLRFAAPRELRTRGGSPQSSVTALPCPAPGGRRPHGPKGWGSPQGVL